MLTRHVSRLYDCCGIPRYLADFVLKHQHTTIYQVVEIVTMCLFTDTVSPELATRVSTGTSEEVIKYMRRCRQSLSNLVDHTTPITKEVISNQHTRHLKNINNDIEFSILHNIEGFQRYSLFVWQKQTTEKMFGSYPYPPNIYEDNTIEFISVYVKEGIPLPLPPEAKEASKLTQQEWRNLTMQVWPIYPEDVKRSGGHPCPFPVTLPLRLIKMYTFRKAPEVGFEGDIVLDMFNGTGATCVASRVSGRNWIGIDISPQFCEIAQRRVMHEEVDPRAILLERVSVKRAKSTVQLSMFTETESRASRSKRVQRIYRKAST
jgi:hypothetical protein